MVGKNTLLRIWHKFQKAVFELCKLEQVIERQEKRELALSMGFVGQWDEHRRYQLAFLKEEGLSNSSSLLEFGCGPLTLGVPLVKYLNPQNYVGIDVRPSVINIAYREIYRNNLVSKNPRLIVANDFGREVLREHKFNFIWAFSMLFHLEDQLVDRLFESAASLLEQEGRLYANINTDVEESTWLEFPFNKRPPTFYEDVAKQHGFNMVVRGTLESTGFRLDSLEKNNIFLMFTLQ